MVKFIRYLCNGGIGLCLGNIIDYFKNTGIIFTIIGFVVGIVLSIFIFKSEEDMPSSDDST